eukprot:TRINITY_DN11662_c0_g1_i1.p2 TRINITY_DN11662_c0_g1~~TRINITY_DN11662_c0_g1_i1.p2  ORF type:complete len:387 (-),score=48.99 TRINITY_DN11662_c0_g1_i1:8-1168(-)
MIICFFVSSSEDGTVKIWDCQRLEKNVTNRSRLTYSSQKGKIKGLTICENSHSVATGSDDGTIHVFRIEYTTKKESTTHRYTGVSTIKNLDIMEGSIVGLEHYNFDFSSLLVLGTTAGKIRGFDLRSRNEAFILKNFPHLGLLSTFTVEPGRNWLVTGTTSGYFTLWDMRFNIPVKTWRHPTKSRISKLGNYRFMRNSPWIFSSVVGNPNEISVWDVESTNCRQLFRVNVGQDSVPISDYKSQVESQLDYGVEELQRPTVLTSNQNDAGFRSFISPAECPYLVTAGDDRKIRFWSLQNVTQSYVICGLNKETPKPKYSSHSSENLTVFSEQCSDDSPESTGNTSKFRGPASPSVFHHESILDVKMMELPHRMLISASRDGVIKVWK